MTLFDPIALGSLTLANRIVMAPMTRSRAGEGNVPTDLTVTYYTQRASAGLIVTEATQVSPQGVGYPATPGIHSRAQVETWRKVTDAVHGAGGKILLQLWHVGRISHPSYHGGEPPVAPSAIRPEGTLFTYEGMKPFETPRALELDEIPGIVEQFARGARNAREAGFDGVEIHGANGYLIDQFLRDGANKRTDRYGGSPENRARFLREVTQAVVGAWSGDRVGVRLSPSGTFNSMSDSERPATFAAAARALDGFGLAYLHLVDALPGDPEPHLSAPFFRPLFNGPIIRNGGYDLDRAERALAEGSADLIAFGASFLANPDLPERLRRKAPLNEPDKATFYGGDARGYIDYPALPVENVAA